ncbi:MAG: hypothetical protein PHW95_02665 [Patescibacteria group bacterium]|nr:hypothetical protein [Patescibacteria group bacterium]
MHVLGFLRILAVLPLYWLPNWLPSKGSTGVAMDSRAVRRILPHRPPMLFIHRVVTIDFVNRGLVAEFDVRWWDLFGHHWAFPGCHTAEAIGQAAIILFSQLSPTQYGQCNPLVGRVIQDCDPIPGEAKFTRIVKAGDTIRLEVELDEIRGALVFFKGIAFVGADPVAVVKRLSLRLVPKAEL